jgi:3',5'-cyclic AMP phosphodiesterase CpdA
MKKMFCLALFIGATFALSAQSHVEGYVYEDLNHNGLRDKNEKGIAQVAVSNGVEVAQTDASGKYRLPAAADCIVFVVKPAGYGSPLDEYNLPQSYYRHKPDGSPESFYAGVKPTGKRLASVDFPLYKQDEPTAFTALLFGDTQPYSEQELDYLKKGIIAEAQHLQGLSFGITLGDLVGDRLDLHPSYKQAIKEIGVPWYNVMGNHDMNYDAKEDRFSDETFEANFGPNNYAFNYGEAHFIVLDDVLYPHPLTGKGYWGGLRDDQFAFVKNDLAFVPHDRLIVVSMHIPLIDSEGYNAFREDDRRELYFMLKDYENVLFLSAHTHFQEQHVVEREGGVPIHEYNVGATCGDWYSGVLDERGVPAATMRDGTPVGYAFLRVEGKRYVLDYKVLGKPEGYQIGIYHPRVVPFGRSGGGFLYANFFMGGASDRVEYRVDDGAWGRMERVLEYDPVYFRYVQDWDYFEELPVGRRPSEPIVCPHLWRVRMPAGLARGEHWVEVRGWDRFGRGWLGVGSYRIE